MRYQALIAILAVGALPACAPDQPVEAVSEADPDLVFVRGYRSADDTCQLTGESAFTVDFLDDAADLVSCPTGSADDASLRASDGAAIVTQTESFTLYSVARR